MSENTRADTFRLPQKKLYSLKKKNPVDKFYKLIAKTVDDQVDVESKRIDVTQVVVHPDSAKAIRSIWRKWIDKDMHYYAKKKRDSADAMNWLCYGPVEDESVSPGFFKIKDLDLLFQDRD
jgi:hypothetical protein